MIADAPGLALFLGANDYAIRKGVEYVGRENFERGDIVLMNYPYWNSAHTMDVTLFAPVFAPRGDAAVCVHLHPGTLDGSRREGPGYVLDSVDIQQEGLILPGLKVYKRGKPDREIFELIRFNSRMPDLVIGDLEAQVAATRTGEQRLIEIHAKFGAERLEAAIPADQASRRVARAAGAWPGCHGAPGRRRIWWTMTASQRCGSDQGYGHALTMTACIAISPALHPRCAARSTCRSG